MKKYSLLIEYIIAVKSFDTQNTGVCCKLNVARLISDISTAIGKRYVYNVIEDNENISYMDKYIENRLDDESIYIDEYEKWLEENKDIELDSN